MGEGWKKCLFFFYTCITCAKQGLRRFKIFLHASGEITEGILLIFLKKEVGVLLWNVKILHAWFWSWGATAVSY